MKKDHPILMSTPMVQATLQEIKKMTRRIVKPDIIIDQGSGYVFVDNHKHQFDIHTWTDDIIKLCPYGQIGDVLWIRETTKVGAWLDEDFKIAFDYKASPELKKTPWCEFDDIEKFHRILEKCTNELSKLNIDPTIEEDEERFYFSWEPGESPLKWTPSIFMPKEACRIFLEIINIRIERLQEISEQDAISEGVYMDDIEKSRFEMASELLKNKIPSTVAEFCFMNLWGNINGAESWDANPWVWVIEFKKIERPCSE